jgi:hypothetical protein
MFKILLDAINRQDFFDKGFPGDGFGTFGYSSCIVVFGVNFSGPAGITIRGSTNEYLRMNIAEIEGLQIGFGGGRHGFSVDEKRESFKRINFGF